MCALPIWGSTSPARSSSLSKQVRCRERRKPRERADLARGAFTIGEDEVAPGERRLISLPMSALANRTPMALPVSVIQGTRDGPTLFASAALHGVEVTRSEYRLAGKEGASTVYPWVVAVSLKKKDKKS